MKTTLPSILKDFDEKFIIPKEHWPPDSSFYKEYKEEIWGKFSPSDIKSFITSSFTDLIREALPEERDNEEFKNDPMHPINAFKVGWNHARQNLITKLKELGVDLEDNK